MAILWFYNTTLSVELLVIFYVSVSFSWQTRLVSGSIIIPNSAACKLCRNIQWMFIIIAFFVYHLFAFLLLLFLREWVVRSFIQNDIIIWADKVYIIGWFEWYAGCNWLQLAFSAKQTLCSHSRYIIRLDHFLQTFKVSVIEEWSHDAFNIKPDSIILQHFVLYW